MAKKRAKLQNRLKNKAKNNQAKKLRTRAGRLKATGLNKYPILAYAGTPVAGTGQGKAKPGQMLLDTTAGKLYFNSGTKQAPVWQRVVLA